MSAYPPALKAAAKNLLDNEDFTVLLKYRMAEMKELITDTHEDREILKAHAEYNMIRELAEWIEMLGEDQLRGQQI